MDERINKMRLLHRQYNINLTLNNKEILSLAKIWVNCEDIMLNETSQS